MSLAGRHLLLSTALWEWEPEFSLLSSLSDSSQAIKKIGILAFFTIMINLQESNQWAGNTYTPLLFENLLVTHPIFPQVYLNAELYNTFGRRFCLFKMLPVWVTNPFIQS